MALGGAGGPANAVPAGAAAQQDDHIPGGGPLPTNILRRCGPHYGAALQPFGHIPLMIDLGHMAGGQTDLVAVGGVSRRRCLAQLSLGQLSFQCLTKGGPGVTRSRKPHGLVDIDPARQGVPDTAADTGCGAAKGLNFSGVIVGLVFEHQ